jgi:hypothetical protein
VVGGYDSNVMPGLKIPAGSDLATFTIYVLRWLCTGC